MVRTMTISSPVFKSFTLTALLEFLDFRICAASKARSSGHDRFAVRRLWRSRTALLSWRLVLRRVWQGPFVLENLTEITAVDPATTGRTPDEMLRFVLRWIANALAEIFARGTPRQSSLIFLSNLLLLPEASPPAPHGFLELEPSHWCDRSDKRGHAK